MPGKVALIVCCFAVLLAAFIQKPFRPPVWRRSYWWVFAQLLFFPLILAAADLFPASGGGPFAKANPYGERILDVLFIPSIVSACVLVYHLKGLRWLAVALMLLEESILSGALFIAGMIVSGDWL
jgi:hypothetical protein